VYTINPWGILVGIVLLDFLWLHRFFAIGNWIGGKKSLAEVKVSLVAGVLFCLTILFLIATTTKT
jgi:hypothetical protein